MNEETTKALTNLAKMFGSDRVLTSQEIDKVLNSILKMLVENRKTTDSLNADTKAQVEKLLNKFLDKYQVFTEDMKTLKEDVTDVEKSMLKKVELKIEEVSYLIEELKKVDTTHEKLEIDDVVQAVMENITLPEVQEMMEISGERIIDLINETANTDENKISWFKIKDVPEFFTTPQSKKGKLKDGGMSPTVLRQAVDLDHTTRADGYAIVWDAATGMHKYAASAGGGSMEIGGSITSATEGSVLFVGASGVLAENNANFFWDDATDRLGIGTSTLTTGKKLTVAEGTMTANQVGGIQITGDIGSNVGSNGLAMALNNSTSNATGFLRLDRTATSTFIGMTLSATSRDGIRIMTHSSSPVEVARFASTFVKTSGTDTAFAITPNISQGGTATYNALYVDVTETSTGSGQRNLLNLLIAASTKFRVDYTGGIFSTGGFTNTSGNMILQGTSASVYLRPTSQSQNNALRIYAGTNGTKLDLYSSAAANSGVENIYYNGVGILQSDADFRLTTARTNTASVVTVGGTQTLTGKKATLAAGTATAGTAPLKFTSGVNLTTAEAGAMEYDGTWAYFTPSGTTRRTFVFADTTQIITNKRNQPRVYTATNNASLTPEIDTYDVFHLTAMSANTTINNHSTSTPADGEIMTFRCLDNGTARTLTFGSAYVAKGGIALPTTTTISKNMSFLFEYNSNLTKWNLIALTQEA